MAGFAGADVFRHPWPFQKCEAVAAEVAGLLLWKTLAEGDRAGGILQNDQQTLEFKPARSRSSALHFMRQLADATQHGPAPANYGLPGQDQLLDSWQRLRRVAEAGAQVFVISDFRGAGHQALRQLAMINRHAQVVLIAINDPFEEHLPEQERLRLSDGRRSIWVNLKLKRWRQDYRQNRTARRESLRDFARKHRMPLVHLSTGDSVIERLLKLTRGMR
ncbi:MAG: hypothetical protein R3E89_18840 [Thiolinea sp.]